MQLLRAHLPSFYLTFNQKEFENLNVDTANAIEKLIGDHLCHQFKIIAKNAYKEQKKLVLQEWIQKPIAWNTHRAINRRMGVWISVRANKDFDWNEQLYVDLSLLCAPLLTITRNNAFLKHLLVLWHETLHKNLPALRKPYDERVDTIIAGFTDLALSAADEISPSIRDSFENIKDSILTHRHRLKQTAGAIFDGIDVSAKDIWRIVKTECEQTCKLMLSLAIGLGLTSSRGRNLSGMW